MTVGKAAVAISAGKNVIDKATLKAQTFGANASAEKPLGARIYSDPVDLATKAPSSVAVSLYLPNRAVVISVHWDGAQTGFISAKGDETMDADFEAGGTTKSRLFLSQIQSNAKPESSVIVFLGDSITDCKIA